MACAESGIEFVEVPVAIDGLSVMTNPANDYIDCMTISELHTLWGPDAEGVITKWDQVRPEWPDEDIRLYGPGVDSGTFDYFTEVVNDEGGASRGDYTASEDDNVLVQGIAGDKHSLGFFGYAYYVENQDKPRLRYGNHRPAATGPGHDPGQAPHSSTEGQEGHVIRQRHADGPPTGSVAPSHGSSTVFPVSEAVAEEFGILTGGKVRVTVGLSGSGGGFKKFCNGETDISNASRPIKGSEVAACAESGIEFVEVPVAIDGLSVMTNPANDYIDCMTIAELNKLWGPDAEGKVTRWDQVRPEWPDEDIRLYGPGVDSGTFDYFTEVVNDEGGASRGDYTASEDDNVLVQGIAGDKHSLGILRLCLLRGEPGQAEAGWASTAAPAASPPTTPPSRTAATSPWHGPSLSTSARTPWPSPTWPSTPGSTWAPKVASS